MYLKKGRKSKRGMEGHSFQKDIRKHWKAKGGGQLDLLSAPSPILLLYMPEKNPKSWCLIFQKIIEQRIAKYLKLYVYTAEKLMLSRG